MEMSAILRAELLAKRLETLGKSRRKHKKTKTVSKEHRMVL